MYKQVPPYSETPKNRNRVTAPMFDCQALQLYIKAIIFTVLLPGFR
jgi:hypothetical protein